MSDNDIHIIMQSRKTLLFNEKRTSVTAEVCDLVGSYLLKKVLNIVDKKSVGLYRDDGLAILQNLLGP